MSKTEYDVIVQKQFPPTAHHKRFKAKVRWHRPSERVEMGSVWGATPQEAKSKMEWKVERFLSSQ